MKPPPSEKPEDFVAGMHEVFSHLLGITNLRMIRPGERNPVSVGDEDSVTSRLNDVECNFIEMLANVRRTRHELHLWEKLRVERLGGQTRTADTIDRGPTTYQTPARQTHSFRTIVIRISVSEGK